MCISVLLYQGTCAQLSHSRQAEPQHSRWSPRKKRRWWQRKMLPRAPCWWPCRTDKHFFSKGNAFSDSWQFIRGWLCMAALSPMSRGGGRRCRAVILPTHSWGTEEDGCGEQTALLHQYDARSPASRLGRSYMQMGVPAGSCPHGCPMLCTAWWVSAAICRLKMRGSPYPVSY